MALEGYHWILGEPAQTDNANYEWVGGEVEVQYEPGAPPAGGGGAWNVTPMVVMAGG